MLQGRVAQRNGIAIFWELLGNPATSTSALACLATMAFHKELNAAFRAHDWSVVLKHLDTERWEGKGGDVPEKEKKRVLSATSVADCWACGLSAASATGSLGDKVPYCIRADWRRGHYRWHSTQGARQWRTKQCIRV